MDNIAPGEDRCDLLSRGATDVVHAGSNMNMYENAIPTTIPYAPDPGKPTKRLSAFPPDLIVSAGWGMDYSPYVVPNLDDPNY